VGRRATETALYVRRERGGTFPSGEGLTARLRSRRVGLQAGCTDTSNPREGRFRNCALALEDALALALRQD
jgi:hypothetical protein